MARLGWIVGIMAFAVGCGGAPAPEPIVPTGPPDLHGRKLIVGSDTTYAPMEYIDPATGKPAGFDIDITEEIAKRSNATVEIVSIPNFATAFDDLAAKKYDLVVSSVTITDARKELVAFSAPYLQVGQVITVKADNTAIRYPQDLAGKNVGVQPGTTGEAEAKKDGVDADHLKGYVDLQVAFADLAAGTIDAVLTDGPASAKAARDSNGAIKVVGTPLTQEHYGVAVVPGDPELLRAVDTALDAMKADGTIDKLMTKYGLEAVALAE